jgi:hypothetical protein
MNDEHQALIDEAKAAIDRLFGDTSVSRAQTRESMEDVIDYAQAAHDALEEDE